MEGRVIPVALTVLQEMTFYRDGNVFTGVCLSTGVGWLGTHPPPVHGTWVTTGYGRQVGGTHPTGMLSCFIHVCTVVLQFMKS